MTHCKNNENDLVYIMKVLVAYRTRSGNTKKIAEAIYDEITTDKDIKTFDEIENIDDYDFSFIGFPMERMGPINLDEEFFQKHAKGKKIGLFITHAAPENSPFLPPWLDKCKKAATDAGAIPEGANVLACAGTEMGLDTTWIMRSCTSANLFHHRKGFRFIELLAKPGIAAIPNLNVRYIR